MTTSGDGVHQGVDDAGDGVGGAGAGGHQHHARLAGGAGVALGGVGRALLVAHQDVAQARLVEQGVVDRQHRAAGIAEQVGHALVDQGAHDDLRAGQDLGGGGGLGGFDGGMGGHEGGFGWECGGGKKKGPRGAFAYATDIAGRRQPPAAIGRRRITSRAPRMGLAPIAINEVMPLRLTRVKSG